MKWFGRGLLAYGLLAACSLIVLQACESKCNILGSGEGCGPLIAAAIITAPVAVPAVLLKEKLDRMKNERHAEANAKLIRAGDIAASAEYVIWSSDSDDELGRKAVSVVLSSWDSPTGSVELFHQPAVFRAIGAQAWATSDAQARRRLYERMAAIAEQRVFWNLIGQGYHFKNDAAAAVSGLLAMREKGTGGFTAEPGLIDRCDLSAYKAIIQYGEIEGADVYLCRTAYRVAYEGHRSEKLEKIEPELHSRSRIRQARLVSN